MVGFSPHESVRLSQKEFAAAGAISGSITRCVCQPLDVVKIRFQGQRLCFLAMNYPASTKQFSYDMTQDLHPDVRKNSIILPDKGLTTRATACRGNKMWILQLQVEPIAKRQNSKYSGIVQAVISIVREEGWQALWKGHVPAQALSITHGMAQFTSFEILTKTAWYFLPEKLTTSQWRPVTHTVCGSLSGCVAAILVHPIDVLRTRLVAQGEPKVYTGLGDACRKILLQEGVQGFYRGLTPSVLQIAPQRGLQFGFYSFFTGLWNEAKGVWLDSAPGYMESLVCGSSAGVASKFLVYPLDVAKKHLQVQGFESARQKFGATQRYSGLGSYLYLVAREQGLKGLYKGLTPGLLKSAMVAGCNFSVYEEVCHIFVSLKSR